MGTGGFADKDIYVNHMSVWGGGGKKRVIGIHTQVKSNCSSYHWSMI